MSALVLWFGLSILICYWSRSVAKPPEMIPITIQNGVVYMNVEVVGGPVPVQRMLIDTGSPHTYLLRVSGSNRFFPQLGVRGGYRSGAISSKSFAKSIDASKSILEVVED